ncbi:22539adc-f3b3-4c7b-a3f9-265d72710d59, partial [Sclerotinia trifoliorum]
NLVYIRRSTDISITLSVILYPSRDTSQPNSKSPNIQKETPSTLNSPSVSEPKPFVKMPSFNQNPFMGNICSKESDNTSVLPSNSAKVTFKKGAKVYWTGQGEISTTPLTPNSPNAPEASSANKNRHTSSEIRSAPSAIFADEEAGLIAVKVNSGRMKETIGPENGKGNFSIRFCYIIQLENGETRKVEEGQLRKDKRVMS